MALSYKLKPFIGRDLEGSEPREVTMKSAKRRLWLPLLVVFAACLPLRAADYLFVFSSGASVSVYDANTFQLAASPFLGPDAVHAVGVPDPNQRDRLLKIYVVRKRSVLVVDPQPPFAIQATLPLSADVTLGERSAKLLPNGRRLVVAAGSFFHVFDVLSPANPAASVVDLETPVTDFSIPPSSQVAYVIRPGLSQLDIVSLTVTPPQRLAGPALLPAPATAVTAASSGSGVFAAADGEIYEIDDPTNALLAIVPSPAGTPSTIGFDPDAPLETGFVGAGSRLALFDSRTRALIRTFTASGTVRKAISPGQDRIFLMAGTPGKFFRAVPSSGLLAEVVHPVTASPFPLPAVDMEVDEAGRYLFLAFGTLGSLVKLSANASSFLGSLEPASVPTGIALVSTLGTAASTLEAYGGNNQFATVGDLLAKPLAVRARSEEGQPVMGELIQFSTEQPGTSIAPATAVTDARGIARTNLEVPVTTPFEVEAATEAGTPSVSFDINVGVEGRDGVHIVSGNYQITSSNSKFPDPFVVRVVDEGLPQPNEALTVTPLNININCTVPAVTDGDGETSFTCSAPFTVTGQRLEQIQVSDSKGRELGEPFNATLVPGAGDLPVILRLFSDDELMGAAGQTLVNAVRFDLVTNGGAPVKDVGVEFVSADDVFVSPNPAITVDDGLTMASVTLGCTLGMGMFSLDPAAPNVASEMVTFTTVVGPPGQLLKVRGDQQFGSAGTRLNQIRVAVRDGCNNPILGAPLTWEVAPPGAATIERASGTANVAGEGFAILRLGNQPGPFQVIARSEETATVFNLSVNTEPAQMVMISGNGQSVIAGEIVAMPLIIEVRDEAGQPLPGAGVSFEVAGGSATLDPVLVQSNSVGRASTTVTAGPGVVPITIVARSSGLTVAFNLTVIGRMPVVPLEGFVNSASYTPEWVPGSAGSIFGVGLTEGVSGVVNANTFPFPITLQGVRVLVNGVPAPITAIVNVNGQEQINIQVPFETPAPATITVTIENNGTSKSFPGIRTVPVQPAIFELIQDAARFAAAAHLNGTLVTPQNPANPGETISLFLTGMGPIVPAVDTNVAGPIPAPLTLAEPLVIFGTRNAVVLGSAYAPTFVTLYQINVVVPPDTPTGLRTLVVAIRDGPSSKPSAIHIAPPQGQ